MKNRLIIITSFLVLLFGQTVLKALDDTLWCKYTYPTSIYAVKFTPDGKYLATGGSDGVVTIWNALTGDSIKAYSKKGSVYSIDISPDGKLFAVAHYTYDSINIYNFQTDSLITTLTGRAVKFSSDGNYLVSANGNIYDTQTWTVIGSFTVFNSTEHIINIDISADNKYIVTAYYLSDGLTTASRLYKLKNLKDSINYTLEQGKGSYNPRVSFSPDGKYLASEASDDTVRIWTLSDKTIYKKFTSSDNIYSLDFSSDNKYFLYGTGILNIFELSTGLLKNSYNIHKIFNIGGVGGISINNNQSLIAIAGGIGGIFMLNAQWNPVSIPDDIITITNNTIYPNPTSSFANIEFTLTKPVQTNINIYDNNLNLINTIYSGLLDIGLHTYTFDTNNIVSGVYYCQININNKITTIKIIVNK